MVEFNVNCKTMKQWKRRANYCTARRGAARLLFATRHEGNQAWQTAAATAACGSGAEADTVLPYYHGYVDHAMKSN